MKTYKHLDDARASHRQHGGVLLDLGEGVYAVVDFHVAVDMRHGNFTDRYDEAAYWATLGANGYDETDALFRKARAAD